MKHILLAIGLLLAAGTCKAQTVVQVALADKSVPLSDACKNYQREVAAEIDAIPDTPPWRVVVTCDENMWRFLRQQFHTQATNTAFTILRTGKQPVTVLHGGEWKVKADLRRSLNHELEHIRCDCMLGE